MDVKGFTQSLPKNNEDQRISALLQHVAQTLEGDDQSKIQDLVMHHGNEINERPSLSVYSLENAHEAGFTGYPFKLLKVTVPKRKAGDSVQLFLAAVEQIKELGKVDLYDVVLKDVIGKNGSNYSLYIYYFPSEEQEEMGS